MHKVGVCQYGEDYTLRGKHSTRRKGVRGPGRPTNRRPCVGSPACLKNASRISFCSDGMLSKSAEVSINY